ASVSRRWGLAHPRAREGERPITVNCVASPRLVAAILPIVQATAGNPLPDVSVVPGLGGYSRSRGWVTRIARVWRGIVRASDALMVSTSWRIQRCEELP